jgi:hypothetical protein
MPARIVEVPGIGGADNFEVLALRMDGQALSLDLAPGTLDPAESRLDGG